MRDAFAQAVLAGLPSLIRGVSPERALLAAGWTFLTVLMGIRRSASQSTSRGVGGRVPAQRAGVIDVEFEEVAEEPPAAVKGLLLAHKDGDEK